MMTLASKFCCGLLVLFTLLACSSHVQSKGKLAELSRDDFMSAMRWKQYGVAAGMMQHEEDREHFMTTFRELKDLHITDVRLVKSKSFEGGNRINVTLEMDYYLPPSVTLETFTFDQTWIYHGEEGSLNQGFLIVTPFPDFP
ncbi:MAG: hypothetical protein GWO08_16050 [Gammaproteobacteria bacterium]|nr:hypothetical protein [Gammaproteobacteria bacterium]